jgi:hypothetical protein
MKQERTKNAEGKQTLARSLLSETLLNRKLR